MHCPNFYSASFKHHFFAMYRYNYPPPPKKRTFSKGRGELGGRETGEAVAGVSQDWWAGRLSDCWLPGCLSDGQSGRWDRGAGRGGGWGWDPPLNLEPSPCLTDGGFNLSLPLPEVCPPQSPAQWLGCGAWADTSFLLCAKWGSYPRGLPVSLRTDCPL